MPSSRLFLRQYKSPLVYLLLGAAVLAFVLGHRTSGGSAAWCPIRERRGVRRLAACQWFDAASCWSELDSVARLHPRRDGRLFLGIGVGVLLWIEKIRKLVARRARKKRAGTPIAGHRPLAAHGGD